MKKEDDDGDKDIANHRTFPAAVIAILLEAEKISFKCKILNAASTLRDQKRRLIHYDKCAKE